MKCKGLNKLLPEVQAHLATGRKTFRAAPWGFATAPFLCGRAEEEAWGIHQLCQAGCTHHSFGHISSNPPGSVFYCLEHDAERTCVMVVPQTLHHWAAELQGSNAPLVELTSSSANYNICYKCCQEWLNFTPCCSSVVGCAMLFINTSWIFWTNQP